VAALVRAPGPAGCVARRRDLLGRRDALEGPWANDFGPAGALRGM